MARIKHFARRAPSPPDYTKTSTGRTPAQVTGQSDCHIEAHWVESYPVTLDWTVQVIENRRQVQYIATLKRAVAIITTRLAGGRIDKVGLAWAKAIGEKEMERREVEKAKEQELEAKRAAIFGSRAQRKSRKGIMVEHAPLVAADPVYLNLNLEDSSSSLTDVSNVSDLRPTSRGSTEELDSRLPDAFRGGSGNESDREDENELLDISEPWLISRDSAGDANSRQVPDSEDGSDCDEIDWETEAAL
ncbi:hypothetical protein DE146DRAFT_163772 [Phaeosphaeria sp. MPI-PUGE-AT-0046c]|nr:hypothetical protein DE146DRAFT_163772 [Phaeosphaeria sp. MPI-PUGE-AT-0046c]